MEDPWEFGIGLSDSISRTVSYLVLIFLETPTLFYGTSYLVFIPVSVSAALGLQSN